MKKNLIYFISLFLILLACTNEEKDLFSQSAAVRLAQAIDDARELFISADNGWVMEYFPNETSGGTNLLMKFGSDGMATVATKNEDFQTYTSDVSTFDVIGDNGPALTFNSYNNVMHYYSDPDNDGLGLEGDYEFIIMDTQEDVVALKGKKRSTPIFLYKLEENKNWEAHLEEILVIDNIVTSDKYTTVFSLYSKETLYNLTATSTHIFSLRQEDSEDEEIHPYVVTNYGIRFINPIRVTEGAVQRFRLTEDRNQLVCIDEGMEDTYITGPSDILDFYLNVTSEGNKWALIEDNAQMNTSLYEIIERVKQSFADRNSTLDQIAFCYSLRYGTDAIFIQNSQGASGYLYLDREVTSDGYLKYTFNGGYDTNGRTFYNNYDGVADLVRLLSSTYSISYLDTKLNLSSLKVKSVLTDDLWFNITIK